MQTLFAISILCSFVLLLAGVAIGRRIRSSHKRINESPQTHTNFAQHLVSAAEGRNLVPSRIVPSQTVKQVMANKSWNQPPEMIPVKSIPELQAASDQDVSQTAASATRKVPQSSYRGVTERLDWAYFNRNRGDLNDPYQAPRLRANSRDKAPSPKRF
jgi:hypothetical protein